MIRFIDSSSLTNEEREELSRLNIQDLIDEYELNMTVDEFIKTYSSNKGVKCTARNVWSNVFSKEYYLKGNKKYLLNLLNNPLAFLEPTGKVISEAQKRASAKYDKENTKQIALKLNLNTDKDIIEFLDKIDNKQGLIKQLIRDEAENYYDIRYLVVNKAYDYFYDFQNNKVIRGEELTKYFDEDELVKIEKDDADYYDYVIYRR